MKKNCEMSGQTMQFIREDEDFFSLENRKNGRGFILYWYMEEGGERKQSLPLGRKAI